MNNIIKTDNFDVDAHQTSTLDTAEKTLPMPPGGFNNHAVTHPSAISSVSGFAAGAGTGSASGISSWTAEEAVPLGSDGISRMWSEAVSRDHAGFNQPVVDREDSLAHSPNSYYFVEGQAKENLRENRIPIEELTPQEKDNFLSALNSMNRLKGNENTAPDANSSLEGAIAQAQTKLDSIKNTLLDPNKREAEKLELLYAVKVINRLSRDPAWVDRTLGSSITHQPVPRMASSPWDRPIGNWTLSPKETAEALKKIISDPQIRIKLTPQQREEIQIAARLVELYIFNNATSQELPRSVARPFAHYAQLRSHLSVIRNDRTNSDQYFPTLSAQELTT